MVTQKCEMIQDKLASCQINQQAMHDRRGVQELPPLALGQCVSVQSDINHNWLLGVITNIRPKPRSYVIETPDGCIVHGNHKHLCK